jgi:hypothetical protein
MFLGGMAGICMPRRDCLVLEAIAAERMPHRMVVSGVERAAYFELRDYGISEPRMLEAWNRCGIRPVLEENGGFLIPFETLAARERAWRELSVDAEWMKLGTRLVLKRIAVFRSVCPLPDGRGSQEGRLTIGRRLPACPTLLHG